MKSKIIACVCSLIFIVTLVVPLNAVAAPVNCIALPSACGFPDATNTGARLPLPVYVGPTTITKAGTAIIGKQINGQLTINANDVVIKNSVLVSQSGTNCNTNDCAAIQYTNASVGGGVYNSTINGNGGKCIIGVEARGGQTVHGDNIFGCGDGVRESLLMTFNYIHGMWLTGRVNGVCVDTPHNDGYQTLGISNAIIRSNTIEIANDASNACSGAGIDSCVYFGDQFQASNNDLVVHNLFDCNSFALRDGPHATNMIFKNNRFVKISGSYGPFLAYSGAPPFVFTGNIWDNDNSPIHP